MAKIEEEIFFDKIKVIWKLERSIRKIIDNKRAEVGKYIQMYLQMELNSQLSEITYKTLKVQYRFSPSNQTKFLIFILIIKL